MPHLPSDGTGRLKRPLKIIWVLAWSCLAAFSAPRVGRALEYSGLVSVEDYYTRDSASTYNFNFLTTRARLDVTDLDENGNLSFHFSGRERLKFSSNDYNGDIRSERLDILNLEYDNVVKGVDVVAGRLMPKGFPVERVDGLNLVYHIGKGGIGLFGGVRPDIYNRFFTTDYPIGGGYLFYQTPDLSADLAFTQVNYKGDIDRQYAYGQMIYNPLKWLRFFLSSTVDVDRDNKKPTLSNLMAEASVRPHVRLNLTVGYNQFRSVKLYASTDFTINNSRQDAYYVRAEYRILDQSYLFTRLERRSLDYPSFDTRRSNSDTVGGGFRTTNLLFTGTRLTAGASYTDGFSSKYQSYDVHLSRLFRNRVDFSLGGTLSKNEYDATNSTDTVWTYDASLGLYLVKHLSVSLYYERINADSYDTDIGTLRVTYRFNSRRK
jgi:hypothetical protein